MSSKCCSRSAWYNIRRYDPIGRTLWVRDYFAGSTGKLIDGLSWLECRVCLLDDVLYVSGPLVWEDESRELTWWNLKAYTIDGQLLWRTYLNTGDGPTAAMDVATVNGKLYALLPSPAWNDSTLIEFDTSGRSVETWPIGPFALRLCVANPEQTYGPLPAGLVTHAPPGAHIDGLATAVAYQPADDDFTISVWPWMPPTTNTVLFRAPRHGDQYDVTSEWQVFPGKWDMTDGPNFFGHLGKSFVDSYDLAVTPDNGTMHVSALGQMILWTNSTGDVVEPTLLGSGTLVRLDEDGNPLWFRSQAVKSCLATDATRLYVGSGFSQPSIARWTFDGELIWAHAHHNIGQIRIIDDRGIVTVGVRALYGVNEQQWIGEIS